MCKSNKIYARLFYSCLLILWVKDNYFKGMLLEWQLFNSLLTADTCACQLAKTKPVGSARAADAGGRAVQLNLECKQHVFVDCSFCRENWMHDIELHNTYMKLNAEHDYHQKPKYNDKKHCCINTNTFTIISVLRQHILTLNTITLR